MRTKLPKSATFIQRATYSFIRSFFHFFFTFLPYYPIKRINKPNLDGVFIWSCSHSNFLCDAVPAGYEGNAPTKFLGKSTLFRFPIKTFIEFCGALPVARAEDYKDKTQESRVAQNRSTFKAAIAAMKDGWPVAIFPEGVSIVSPGLTLPLKPGVAKLALSAEDDSDFNLGLRIIPVGLEYGSRVKVASGLNIRYGKPILVSRYKDDYKENEQQAVKKLMNELTEQMVSVFPHFEDEHKQTIGKKLVALGLVRSKYDAAQLFLARKNAPEFWSGLDKKMKAFEEVTRNSGIPVPAWGLRRIWKELGPIRRAKRRLYILFGLPFAIIDALNNSLPEFVLSSTVDLIAVDETEKMTLRFMASPILLGLVYCAQFIFFKYIVFESYMQNMGFGSYIIYCLCSFMLWYFGVHWRRQFKRWFSLLFFYKAGIDAKSESVARYKELRKHLSDF
ncbi:MAG: 1-acyl-sn-glycerol-3-phosphate acyltransferase [Oligoflexia bacterium]|nr:1-acyl-sn-glycerol-3-phosphate acyltransferase [Oligoflexia bacterium]